MFREMRPGGRRPKEFQWTVLLRSDILRFDTTITTRTHKTGAELREADAEGRFICDKVEIYSSATHNREFYQQSYEVGTLLYISAAESVAPSD